MALEQVNAEKRIIDINIDIIDKNAPEKFSYIDAAIVALASGKKTPREIAESIVAQREASF